MNDVSYKQLLKDIKLKFNKWDPMGLIESGSPEDEYDHYIQKLTSWIQKGLSEAEVAKLLSEELSNMFGEAYAAKDCLPFIQDIKKDLS